LIATGINRTAHAAFASVRHHVSIREQFRSPPAEGSAGVPGGSATGPGSSETPHARRPSDFFNNLRRALAMANSGGLIPYPLPKVFRMQPARGVKAPFKGSENDRASVARRPSANEQVALELTGGAIRKVKV
jgi:hypothetical protein